MFGMRKRQQDESGLIQGAGTSTSDDIKKNVPAGSYIMPADSTKKIGARNLKNLGRPTPVNVSNGEFQLSPDQVHSVGVQTLDAMKDQTHMPVNQPQLGFKPGVTMAQAQPQGEPPKLGFNPAALAKYQDNIKMGESGKPELFFEHGGGVPDEDTILGLSKKAFTGNALGQPKPQAPATPPQSKSTSQQNSGFGAFAKNVIAPTHDDGSWNPVGGLMNTATGLGGAALGTAGGLAAGAGEAARSTAATLGGADNPNRGNLVAPSFDFAGEGLNQAKLGVRQMFGLTPKDSGSTATTTPASSTPPPVATTQPDLAKAPDLATQAAEKAKADAAAKVAAATTPPPASMFGETQQPTAQQNTPNPYAIQQKGNSFSYANPGAAAQARAAGVPELQGSGVQTGLGIRGVNNFMANTPEFNGGFSVERARQAREQANLMARSELNIGMQGYGGIARQPQVPERTLEQEAQLQAEIKRVSAPIAGARGLTASQRNQINDLQQGYSNRENDVYKTDANNATALQREAMGQVGQNYRAELGELGANDRFNSNLNLDAQKFNATNDLANRQFTAEQLSKMPERMKQQAELNLLQQYDAAQTPEERQPILERLNLIRGQGQQQKEDKLFPFKQHEIVDAQGNVTQFAKDMFYDRTTDRAIDPMANMQSQQIPLGAIDALRKNPDKIAEFEDKYGQGSAAKYLT